MSEPIGPYEPFYDGGYKDLPDNTTPPKADALSHWDKWFGTVVDKVDGLVTGAVDTTGSTSGEVLTVVTPGQPATFQVPADVAAAAATAVAAYLAAHPPGNTVGTVGYLLLTGDATGPCVQCAVSPNYGGSFELIFDDLALANLNNGANQTLWAIQNSTAANSILRENSNGKLSLLVYPSPGTTPVTGTASVNTPAGLTKLRVTWDQSTGRLIFWKPSTNAFKSTNGVTHGSPNQKTFDDASASFDSAKHTGMVLFAPQFPGGYTTIQSVNSATSVHTADNASGAATSVSYAVGAVLSDGTLWENIGTIQTAQISGGGARFISTALPMTVGAVGNGTALAAAGTKMGKVRYYSGYENPDGTGTKTLLADPTFSGRDTAISSFTDTESNVWSMKGTALIVAKTLTITKDGQTYTVVTPGYLQSRLGTFDPKDYGDLTTSDESRRAAVQAAIDDGYRVGGGVVPIRSLLTVGPNSSLNDMRKGTPWAAIHAKDNVRLAGDDPTAVGLKLAANANCHLVAHPGRLNGSLLQDNIPGFSIRGLLLDGNKTNQDQCHDHDGLRFAQYPRLRVQDVVIQNCDGHGYYSSANGDFSGSISDLDQNSNATLVKPLWLHTASFLNNARWGAMMSATNRKTSEKDLYASGNGTAQARVVGQKTNPAITTGGHLDLYIDAASSSVPVTLAASLTGAQVVTAINSALAGAGTAALITNRLAITSAVTGGASRVGVAATSTAQVLLDLGLSVPTSAGPLPGVPLHRNGDNDADVGGMEYGGFYADHSEASTDSWFADGNIGIGIYVHNVQLCGFGLLHSNNNNGIGVVVQQLNTSGIREIIAAMNCIDPGFASYLGKTMGGAGGAAIAIPKAEILFGGNTGGYGPSRYSSVTKIVAPGLKSYGPLADNRLADVALAIDHAVDPSMTFERLIYGDGGLNADGSPLGGNIRDYR